ncbi:chromosome segregation protein SMC [Solemya velesiana gill symbiont]|uniref:Chromosome partition protein Smc n=1 Tax=Solemya velesiana gill symbiont TaxID=1918948 RepID=A0A1T2KVU7_9GAMM|nr:chromosome segregation protein SMC [Solemya velesiana gill symbiont]OOZ36987.1 chromosome segregation protein SMC [Solemya velesiana gill symbiont]
MRLEKIKLAGFKSFVDPTTVPFPSNLVGIVGPNGCGKSNVIDAVRWVMGESSAKMLRGESMADVIFNGSTSRKPVGTASIELVFDNADGGAGGQYAQYSQIAVKRQVSRDGQSSYFMNGVRCRRRDITDLFLGTGLGPRSYSIIEQGMISRLIEARPEDLRAFLEEAAGISKYKERRRDTENRIKHTRENLDRLNDLREEIAKQLQHLQRQAATAEKYKEYKEQERRLKAELLALRWSALDEDIKARDRTITEKETDLEAAIAKQRRLEADIERDRETHVEANDHFNEVQGRFYAVGSDIARLEQAIQFSKESRAQNEHDLHQTEQAWQESSDHRVQDENRLNELNETLAEEEPRLEEARAIEQESAERLAEAEQTMQTWQSEWENFNRQAAEPAQTAQVERTRINHIEEQDQNLQRRIEKFTEELTRLEDPRLAQEIVELENQETAREEQVAQLQEHVAAAVRNITGLRQSSVNLNNELNEVRASLQTMHGRHASLEALQQAALGKDESATTQWLEQHDLDRASRLAEKIEVESGWQRAVETVLGFHLQAVCVDNFGNLGSELAALESGSLSLFDTSSNTRHSSIAGSIAEKVKAPWPLDGVLGGILHADSIEQAMGMRNSLEAGQSIITRDGVWVGSNWMRLSRETGETGGVLEREEEIRELAEQINAQETKAEELAAAVEQGREQVHQAEHEREQRQKELNEANRTLSDIRSNLTGKRTRAEHLRNRIDHVRGEMEDLSRQLEQGRGDLEMAREKLHASLEEMETLGERRDGLIQRRDELRQRLTEIREEAGTQRGRAHEIALRIESMRSSRESLAQSLERMQGQLVRLATRREELKLALEESSAPLVEQSEELEKQLARRVEMESELTKARQALEEIDARLRGLEQDRHRAEQEVQTQRSSLDQFKMQRQEVLVRSKTIEEQLAETGFMREELFMELPGDANVEKWQQEVERMDLRIRRLGPINLAAIDEFQEQSERMHYLDTQHADVTESLETLENAIRKIDRETRTRFKETFDKVNSGLQEKFPQLFGGGHAYLQLTGEDLLDTGVTVMARPPGKRNSSIHLLSGGEKALTAVALVFAIFELNPAPFCMLDEVDAPLDDANVGRFCDMVRLMSDRVQFIFITHNKITMELSNQLTGVTMHEPGVSRLVSVDVEEAAQMAAM